MPPSEDRPNIYSLMQVAVIGELGEHTVYDEPKVCPTCKRPLPRPVAIEYEFDRWAGEDLVEAMGEYAVSTRLRKAIEEAAITGIRFEKMRTAQGQDFHITKKAYERALPRFHWMVIVGRADGPEIWAVSRVCSTCGRRIWKTTDTGVDAITSAGTGKPGPTRKVYRDSWKGDDVFQLQDELVPVVTQKFVDLLEKVGVRPVEFQPAEWVDR